jgi:hypothetical protein
MKRLVGIKCLVSAEWGWPLFLLANEMLESQGLSAFKGFQSPQMRKNSKLLPIYIYIYIFPVCSQEYKTMIKDL